MDMYSSQDTLEKAKALLQQMGKGYSSGDGENKYRWFNFPSGVEKVTLRALPLFQNNAYMVIFRHHNLPGENKNYLCLRTHGMNCPICEVVSKYSGRMEMKDWAAVQKVFLNALFIRATDDKGNLITITDGNKQPYQLGVPYIVSFSGALFRWLIESLADPERGDVTHPTTGRNLTLQRERHNGPFKKEFSFQPNAIASTPEDIAKIMEQTYDLSKVWRLPDDEFMKKGRETAQLLDSTLTQKLNELMAPAGSMQAMHPRAPMAPSPAMAYANPTSQPAPVAQPAPPVVQQQPAAAYVPPTTPVVAPVQQPAVQATPQPAPVAQTAQQPVAAQPSAVKVPPGAPPCFANNTVFSKSNSKCMICNYEYHCERAINASQPATA
jgi:hypothetical protein